MNQTIKDRIAKINNGQVPKGYEKTSFGIFPCDWEKKKLQQICDIFSGGTPSTNIPKYWDGNIAWCVPTDITRNKKYIDSTEKYISQEGLENSSAKIMPVNSILMCSRATIGPRCINRVPMATNQGFKNLVCKKGYYYEFIYYYIEILLNHLLKKSNGSTFLELSKSELDKSECVIPQLKQEQSRIAEVLMQWDKAIELQEKLIEAKQKLKKYYLKKMFPKKGSNIPEIRFPGFTAPWEQRKLGEISDSYSGGTPTVGVKEYYEGQIPFIRSAEINSEITELFLTEDGLKNSSARLVDLGDILYALYGATSGEVGRARIKGAINQAILAIKPHSGYDSEYLAQWLRKSKQSIIETYLQGGQGNLSGAIVKELLVDFPTFEEQQAIGAYFKQFDNLITLHQQKRDKLVAQRKAMQQYLLTGIVRV